MKNGRTILADHVRENGSRYEYEIGEDSYAIPKSSVERVDAGGLPVHSGGSANIPDMPTFTPADSLANEGDLVGKIIKDDKVDDDALAGLKKKGNAEFSATADFIAGKFEFDHGNNRSIPAIFRKRSAGSSRTIPPSLFITPLCSYGRAMLPGAHLRSARRAFCPRFPRRFTMLGYAQFASDHTKDAVDLVEAFARTPS